MMILVLPVIEFSATVHKLGTNFRNDLHRCGFIVIDGYAYTVAAFDGANNVSASVFATDRFYGFECSFGAFYRATIPKSNLKRV